MLERIGTKDKVPAFVEGVKNRKEKMFGFGHRCDAALEGVAVSILVCVSVALLHGYSRGACAMHIRGGMTGLVAGLPLP